nr:hypothetical protein [Tanacetum cinerariifolium]
MVKVLLVRELKEMLQVHIETIQLVKQSQELDEEQLVFLADPRIPDGQAIQTTFSHNVAFQIDDLDAYDSDCDDISSAKAILMANLSSYDSEVLHEEQYSDTYQHEVIN